MREFIMVNEAVMHRNGVGGITKVEWIKQIIIPTSRIINVSPLSGKIKKEAIPEEVKEQVKGMSLEDDLGGSLITYQDDIPGKLGYMEVLETVEAIYRRIYPE